MLPTWGRWAYTFTGSGTETRPTPLRWRSWWRVPRGRRRDGSFPALQGGTRVLRRSPQGEIPGHRAALRSGGSLRQGGQHARAAQPGFGPGRKGDGSRQEVEIQARPQGWQGGDGGSADRSQPRAVVRKFGS